MDYYLKFKGTNSELNLNSNYREKKGIVSIITGLAAIAYEGISAYLKWEMNKAIEKGYNVTQSHQTVLKNRLCKINQELTS